MGQFDRSLGAKLQTMDSLQSLLHGPDFIRRAQIKALPRLVCSDGFTISVQASDFHRCEPMNVTGPYSSVECAFPSRKTDKLMPYICEEEGIEPEQSCYHFVPVEIVVTIINDHGGLIL